MDEFTELEMADAFEHTLKASLVKGIPNFDILYREVSCQQGIPDFVGLSSAVLIQNYDFSNLTATESCNNVNFEKKFWPQKRIYQGKNCTF